MKVLCIDLTGMIAHPDFLSPLSRDCPCSRPCLAWENESMAFVSRSLRSARTKAVLIILLVVTLATFTWLAPPHEVVLHNVLHHLNILPFMLAGMLFGWRGAVKTVLLATVLQAPSIHRHWFRAPLDAQDQLVELSTFGAAGVIAGLLADRERLQRKHVETTKLELERVYTELRQNIDQLKKNERLSAAGQLSASLAHEIRNPLASISGAAGILARGHASPEARDECLEILTKESQRLNKLLTNFLDFARPRLPRMQRIEPFEMVQSIATLAQHAAGQHRISLRDQEAGSLPDIECDPEQIKQLLLNLVLNAIQATQENGVVSISTFATDDSLFVEIADDGTGIASEDLEHIFDPFFTTRKDGTGLGLAIASNIAAQHGGSITCRPNDVQGTIFRLELPATAIAYSVRTS
jgi:two-component system, NtrC family, sensor histidine kinase HydH